MAKTKLDYNEVVEAFPKLKDITLNGADDFNNIAAVLGSRNPNYVWPVRNALVAGVKQAPNPKLARLFG